MVHRGALPEGRDLGHVHDTVDAHPIDGDPDAVVVVDGEVAGWMGRRRTGYGDQSQPGDEPGDHELTPPTHRAPPSSPAKVAFAMGALSGDHAGFRASEAASQVRAAPVS